MDLVTPNFEFTPLLAILILLELVLKGIALWKCGRNNQLAWYIALFIINSAGILPIIYLIWFQKNKNMGSIGDVN